MDMYAAFLASFHVDFTEMYTRLHKVTQGYTRLHVWTCMIIDGHVCSISGVISRGFYGDVHMVTQGYTRLHKVTCMDMYDYRWTHGYTRLHKVTQGYMYGHV